MTRQIGDGLPNVDSFIADLIQKSAEEEPNVSSKEKGNAYLVGKRYREQGSPSARTQRIMGPSPGGKNPGGSLKDDYNPLDDDNESNQ